VFSLIVQPRNSNHASEFPCFGSIVSSLTTILDHKAKEEEEEDEKKHNQATKLPSYVDPVMLRRTADPPMSSLSLESRGRSTMRPTHVH
jgi:hypothetical protein